MSGISFRKINLPYFMNNVRKLRFKEKEAEKFQDDR
jgi:hypothetical protein